MTEQVRIGVIGTSWYADLAHLPRVKSRLDAELAAICGRNRVRAEEMAAKYGIPLVFTDYRAMIEKGDLDAVIVSTPDDLHYPMTMDALDAGLHVLCEKPMALDRTQAKQMYEKAEAAGVKHMVCFTYRWMSHYRHLKHLVDQATSVVAFTAVSAILPDREAPHSTSGDMIGAVVSAPWGTWVHI